MSWLPDLLALIGLSMIGLGLAFVSVPLALVVVGVLLLAAGVHGAWHEPPGPTPSA